jgi:predicted membrane protein
VVVPNGVEVTVDGDVGIGELLLFGESDDGFEANSTVARPGREGSGELHLEVDGGIGRVEVRRPIVDARTGEGS